MQIIFSKILKELMTANKLNQVQLAQKSGIKQNTICAWLLNRNQPSIQSLWLLADFFDEDIDYLVGRKSY